MSPKKLAAFIAVPLLALLAACGATADLEGLDDSTAETAVPAEEPEPEAEPEPEQEAPAVQELVVVNSAFGQRTYDPTVWWFAVVLENPNPEHVFPMASVDVEAIAADGTILDTGSSYVEILPGQVAVTGTFFSVGSNIIDRIDVRGPLAAGSSAPVPANGAGTFTVTDLAAATDEWSTTVGGNLTGTFAAEHELVEVVVIASNPSGAIIGAEQTFVDRLPVGAVVRFEARFLDPLPADTVYTAYPSL